MPQPPEEENRPLTWPYWPIKLRTSSSHQEGCEREFAISTKELIGEKGKVTGLKTVRVEWKEAASIEEVEAESDILVVATDSSSAVTYGSRLKDEVLVISMGANQPVKHEVSVELIRKMDLIVTDDLATAQGDSGDLIAACGAGIIRWEDVIPLEKTIQGGLAENRPKKILFQSNGIADEDLAVGRYVFEQVKRKKIKARKIAEV